MATLKYNEFLRIAKDVLEGTLASVREVLRPYEIEIEEITDISFTQDMRDAVGVYESGSVFSKNIRFGVNYMQIYQCVKEVRSHYPEEYFENWFNDIKVAIGITVWHEAMHALWEYIDDLLWNCSEIRQSLYRIDGNAMLVYRVREDEEEIIEKAARAFYDGMDQNDSFCRFIMDFPNHIK